MKLIEIEDDLYQYIAEHTQNIGENASDILRRMLNYYPQGKAAEKVVTEQAALIEPQQVKQMSQHISEFLTSDRLMKQKKVVDRFILILRELYLLHPALFKKATESLSGSKRVYFADNERTLLKFGSQTRPKVITDTPYWVITNTNTERKRNMVERVMSAMNFPETLIKKVCQLI